METQHERRARARKVARLLAACRWHHIDAATARNLDQQGRDALAALHDVKAPSEKTWAGVVRELEQDEARHADPAYDPFVGLGQ